MKTVKGMLYYLNDKLNDKLRKAYRFHIIGNWEIWAGRKPYVGNMWGRCRTALASPDNKYIPRVKNAGAIRGNSLIMHNGIKVLMGKHAFYGRFAYILLKVNRGVHEPQEERVFMEVLKNLPDHATMVELGSYWAFYSMWFHKEIKYANCYMIEPEEDFLKCGVANFELNKMTGTFIKGAVGNNGIKIDDFIKERRLEAVHILHADIQGFELEMLHSCKRSIAERKIWYFFISTHSQELHYDCLSFLQNNGYEIIASADFDFGTYSHDGVLIARLSSIKGVAPVDISLRVAL